MQRKPLLVVLLALAALAIGAFFAFSGDAAPPPVPVEPTRDQEAPVDVPRSVDGELGHQPSDASTKREAVKGGDASVEDDPEIRAAMTGYKGRVVDHAKTPVAKCGVRLYRGAVDSLLRPGVDLFSEVPTMEPSYVAGETTTADDGTFVIGGVWPRGFCLLFAGIGTDAPTHRIVAVTPEPGEVVDLGDVVLNDAAVAVGRVVDEHGGPVAGALVRTADLPGQVLDFVPLERFDPAGCLLIREKNAPVQVVEFPQWVAEAFERLPIPQATSDADGRFRLVGIAPGSNLVAATKKGLVGSVQKAVRFEAGKTKDLGELKLTEGEEVSVKVVDAAGKPVAGAEVVCGSVGLVAPVDFGMRMGQTDAEGRVSGLGFGRGKATAAARRSPKDPWVMAESQPILNDVVVTLPTTASLQVRVTFAGNTVKEPQLRLLQSGEEEPARMMALLGMMKSIDLANRTKVQEDGSLLVNDLPLGKYVLLAKTEGSVTATEKLAITLGMQPVTVELQPAKTVVVRVVGPDDAPIRNAVVYVVDTKDRHRGDFPIVGGHTDAQGRVTVSELQGDEGRCSAEHPKWGLAHARFDNRNSEVLIRMQVPGWIEGKLVQNDKPAEFGKYTIATLLQVNWQDRKEAIEAAPLLSTPTSDGTFFVRALQPGKYRLQTVSALDALSSPGGVMELGQNMWQEEMPSEEVEVISGQGAQCVLDFGGKKYDGPTGAVVGFVQVDGRAAEGSVMQAWTQSGRRVTKIEATGRFEMRDVPAGNLHLMLLPTPSDSTGMFNRDALWYHSYDLEAGQTIDVQLDVRTTSCSGVALAPGGVPVAGLNVSAQGKPLDAKTRAEEFQVWRNTVTDAEGRFSFSRIPEGLYTIEVARWGGNEDEKYRGSLADVRVESGRDRSDLVLQLRAAIKISGTVDLSGLPNRPDWSWISFLRVDPAAPTDRTKAQDQAGGFGVGDDGTFESSDLEAGSYFVNYHFQQGEDWKTWIVQDPVVVPETGLSGLVLRPVPMPERVR